MDRSGVEGILVPSFLDNCREIEKEVDLTQSVLIVDDNTNLAHLTAYSLKSAIDGLIVLTAGSCQEALILAKEHRPSVFIVDLKLPDGDGLDLIDELKRRFPSVSPILVTATPWRWDFDSSLFGMLIKPYDPDSLIDLVRQALNPEDTTRARSLAGERHPNETEPPSSQYQTFITRKTDCQRCWWEFEPYDWNCSLWRTTLPRFGGSQTNTPTD